MKRKILGTAAMALTFASTAALAHGVTAASLMIFRDVGELRNAPVVASSAAKGQTQNAAILVNSKVSDINAHPSPSSPVPPTLPPNVPGSNNVGSVGTSGSGSTIATDPQFVAVPVPVTVPVLVTVPGPAPVPFVAPSQPQVTNAPEMDASSMATSLTLLLGAVVVMRGRRRKA